MAASSSAREQIHIRLSLARSARAELERIAEQDRRSLASAALVGYRGMVESSASKRGSGTWLIPRPQTRTHRHRRLHRLHPRPARSRVRDTTRRSLIRHSTGLVRRINPGSCACAPRPAASGCRDLISNRTRLRSPRRRLHLVIHRPARRRCGR